ncbi:hypothetical protein ACIOEZ_32655 [Streptomyces sp. NPDC087866]|uniref:hypothetical protein n=1 Tax=Streptomyces TaxID=1883 RepID=UPI0036910257
MLKRLRDTVIEAKGQHGLTRGIKDAVAAGDQEAAASFTSGTGTLRALTRTGRERRGAEISEYAQRVIAADGNGNRVHRLGS